MPEDDSQRLFAAICRLQKNSSRLHHLSDLSPSEFMVFNHVYRLQGDQGVRASNLSTHTRLSRSSISHLLRSLEAKGLTERTTCHEDRRAVYVRATENGCELYGAMTAKIKSYTEEVLRRMGHEKAEQLIALLNELADTLSDVLQ